MRSIWKGSVSFGLVSIGVKMYAATEERDVSFHQVRRSDGSRIRYKRVAEADGAEVAYSDIAKGYSLPNGEVVVLDDGDFADLPLPTARVVDVLQFVPIDQIDPIYYAKSYYLEPEQPAVKPYVLLREALEDSGMVGLVKVAIRNREQLAVLRVRDGVIVLETMIWPDEVREAEFAFLDSDVELRPQEKAMAESLVTSMAGDFDPTLYTDEYREALQEVINAKVEGREVAQVEPTTSGGGQVVDLMAALRASVDAAKRSRGAETSENAAPSGGEERSAARSPAKRSAKATTSAKLAGTKAATKVSGKKAAAAAAKSPAKRAVKSAPKATKTAARRRSA